MIPPGQKQILIFQITSRGEGGINSPLVINLSPFNTNYPSRFILFGSINLNYFNNIYFEVSRVFVRYFCTNNLTIILYCFSQFASFNIPLQMSSSVQVEFKKRKKGNFIKSRSIELNFSENRFILLALDRWLNGISINSKNLSEDFF